MGIRFPRTWLGWKNLFWLSLHRCIVCHGKTYTNWPYDSHIRYCMPCGGAMFPLGVLDALRQNYKAWLKDCEKARAALEKLK